MKEKRKLSINGVMALVIMVIMGVLAVDGYLVKRLPSDALRFPTFLFILSFVAGMFEILKDLKLIGKKTDVADDRKKREPVFTNHCNFFFFCGLVLAYLLGMYLFGFIIASTVFSVVFAVRFRYRHIVLFVIGAAVLSVGLYLVFTKLIYVHLPVGLLIEKILR